MSKNQFGKVSTLSLDVDFKEEKTYLRDVSFTAPYKIMQPFPMEKGGIQVMLLSASAGIMEGDCQDFSFHIRSGARMEFFSQSYDKIHQMREGCAVRKTAVHLEPGTFFRYCPQPTIPFKDSAFESRMEISLSDETSRFQMGEILSCGRYARGERFAYHFYHNLVEIRRKGRLIYRDNSRYDPDLFPMEGMGMYEDYTHLSNLFFTRPSSPDFPGQVQKLLEKGEDWEGAVTELSEGDFAVRIFGRRAQVLEELNQKLFKLSQE